MSKDPTRPHTAPPIPHGDTSGQDENPLAHPSRPARHLYEQAPAAGPASSTLWTKPPPGNPPPPPVPTDPFRLLDEVEPPAAYGRDTIALLVRDPRTLFACWELTPAAFASAVAQLGHPPHPHRVLRMAWSPPGYPSEGEHSRDFVVHTDIGRSFLPAPWHEGSWVRLVLGVLGTGNAFAKVAESPAIRVPYASPGPDGPLEWLYVEPLRIRSKARNELVLEPRELGGRVPLETRGGEYRGFGASDQLGRRQTVPSSSSLPTPTAAPTPTKGKNS